MEMFNRRLNTMFVGRDKAGGAAVLFATHTKTLLQVAGDVC
jgi:hypothetical protein